MLGLQLPTDKRWAILVENNLQEALTDHAWCEQKAASSAISLIVSYPELTDMVDILLEIAREELLHFSQVHDKIKARGWKLGPERKDDYVNRLLQFVRKGQDRKTALLDRLIFAAMIEARSCERFRLLSQTVQDTELAQFYHELMVSEATHYTTFLKLARQYCETEEVQKRWQAMLAYEAIVIQDYGKRETIHG